MMHRHRKICQKICWSWWVWCRGTKVKHEEQHRSYTEKYF